MSWLHQLDRLERYFSRAVLDYHKIPHQLRHSPTINNGAKISPAVLRRLSDIFETDRPRTQQSYFIPWFEIRDAAVNVLQDLKYYQPLADDVHFLRSVDREFDHAFAKVHKPFRNAKVALRWLVESVKEVSVRADLDASEALASTYSREGSLIRRWISTLPEPNCRSGRRKLEYIEEYVQLVLTEGVEKGMYWTEFVDLSGYGSA